ncbi:hypothetical protein DSUL_150051 [Desulfovibrionales bacterium]
MDFISTHKELTGEFSLYVVKFRFVHIFDSYPWLKYHLGRVLGLLGRPVTTLYLSFFGLPEGFSDFIGRCCLDGYLCAPELDVWFPQSIPGTAFRWIGSL